MIARRPRRPLREDAAPAAPSHVRETVAVIGAGRLGTALALALAEQGYDITCLVAERESNARRGARLVARLAAVPAPLALGADELDRLPPSLIYMFATPDDRLAAAAGSLAASLAATNDARRAVALHTSGALASDVLAPLAAHGCATGSLHPLVAIANDARQGAASLIGASYAIEGDRRAASCARRVVRRLGGRAFTIRPDSKALYHAAAVIASGHAVALFDLACALLARCGLDAGEARSVLLPLVASTARNLAARPPAEALTGTFARADLATLDLHLAALQRAEESDAGGAADANNRADLSGALEIYRLLGRRALRLARENGADADALARLARRLDEDDPPARR